MRLLFKGLILLPIVILLTIAVGYVLLEFALPMTESLWLIDDGSRGRPRLFFYIVAAVVLVFAAVLKGITMLLDWLVFGDGVWQKRGRMKWLILLPVAFFLLASAAYVCIVYVLPVL